MCADTLVHMHKQIWPHTIVHTKQTYYKRKKTERRHEEKLVEQICWLCGLFDDAPWQQLAGRASTVSINLGKTKLSVFGFNNM